MMLDSQPCLRTAPNKSDEAPEGCLGYVSGSTRPTATAARAESGGGFPIPRGSVRHAKARQGGSHVAPTER